MFEFINYDFMQNAILASILASIAFGIVGSLIVVRKIVFISGGISHSVFGGIGLGYLLGINPLFSAIAASIGASTFITITRSHKSQHEDTLIGVMWAFGMALGTIFINLTPGYAPDLMSYLFGNILTISTQDLYLILVLDLVIVITTILFFREFVAITFDEEYSQVIGLPVKFLTWLLLTLVALATVILIKLVGIILVIALMSIPSSISLNHSKSLKSMIYLSILLGIIFTVIGLLLSYYLNLASGAAIILVSVFFYSIDYLLHRWIIK